MSLLDALQQRSSLGILTLHASAVSVDGGVWIFLGPSGTGKSTISYLLSSYATLWADDMIYLIQQGDQLWGVANASYRREQAGILTVQQILALERLPLRYVFRLRQAPMASLRRRSDLEVCRYLTDSLFEIFAYRWFDASVKKRLFSSVCSVARSTPGYELHFDLSPSVFNLIKSEA